MITEVVGVALDLVVFVDRAQTGLMFAGVLGLSMAGAGVVGIVRARRAGASC